MKKRILAGIFCLCMVLTLVPMQVLAAEPSGNWADIVTAQPAGYVIDGSGNVTISSAEGLAWLASVVNGLNGHTADDLTGKTVKLAGDIELGAHLFTPIGNASTSFKGTFDGGGHSISAMTVNIAGDYDDFNVYAGLFGYVGLGCTVKNVSVSGNVQVSGFSVYNHQYNYTGGIVGYSSSGTVTNCNFSGEVNASDAGYRNHVGGIVGYSYMGTVTNCNCFGEVNSIDANDWGIAGGIAGCNEGTMTNCYNTGTVTASGDGLANVAGGIAGMNNYDSEIVNCYNTGEVTASGSNSQNFSGGVTGHGDYSMMMNCYNTGAVNASGGTNNSGGGIVGYSYFDTVTNCYWLDTSASDVKGGGGSTITNCASFTVAQGDGTDATFEYSIDDSTGTGTLCDALNDWVSVQTTPSNYFGWRTIDGINSNYPVLLPKFTVTFNANDGTVDTQTKTVFLDETYGELPTPTRSGYEFDGWYTEADGGTQVISTDTVNLAADQTLYAQWTPAALTGTVSITGDTIFGETLTANVSSSNNTGTLSYQWQRGGADITDATDSTYTLAAEDIGQTITCVVTGSVQSGFITGTAAGTIAKAEGPAIVGVTKTDCTTSANNDGTLVGVTAQMEYKLSAEEDWTTGDDSTITGLVNGTYIVRHKETATHYAGAESSFVIAGYTPPSSGSGGGFTITVPVTGGSQTVNVTVTTSVNACALNPLSKSELKRITDGAAAAGECVSIDLGSLSNRLDKVIIPRDILLAVVDADAPGLNITMPDGKSVSFDSEALGAILSSGSGNLKLSVREVSADSLTDSQRRLVGDAPVLDLTAYIGTKQVHDFGGGLVTVNIPASGKPVENPIIWRMMTDSGGKVSLEAIMCTYNAKTKCYEFLTSTFSLYVIGSYPFTDTPDSAWYYEDVVYAYVNGLFNGTSDTNFSPNEAMTRGMLVTVLWRMEGSPVATAAGFSDIASGAWYADAVNWAAANNIVAGFGDNRFKPNDNITREQMAVILYRYAQYKGYDVSVGEDTNILSYKDAFDISEYAIPAMQWACGAGLIQGSDGDLMPQGNATRAQVAAILNRFDVNVAM